ncbi:hypothetical protein RchiOBHm_Chr4g0428531 [Rosa chinensis]|uniref:Uncharacterized protein n=1 Tax=Rosa chinensis TaxID=74649 RepID=A0A2P6QZX8_ROSCH|nr:uncharacterized protein LOC112195791 [Rosa chinensis]PRQ39740.1 hypothetical protein RchiOBHm_Chr4g0428531 [Rosa chinensis]
MASRAANYCRSLLTQLGEKRSFATSTIPNMKPATAHVSSLSDKEQKILDKVEKRAALMKAENAPIWIVAGMVGAAVLIAIHTAKQQLVHSPVVNFRKTKRESVPEVDDPDAVVGSADKFISKSFLRKVAHIQDNTNTVHDPSRPNPFTAPRKAETLKSVGVEPSSRY